MNNDVLKGIILVSMILYVVSPVDLAPGPVDDMIALLIGVAARRRLTKADNVQ